MLKKNSLKFNAIMNALLNVSTLLFPLITFPYVSRILLPIGIGKVALATSIIQYFNMFAQLGIPTYGIRACAKVRDDKFELSKVAHELFFINICASLIALFALWMTVLFVPKMYNEKALYQMLCSSIILTTIGCEWLYKGLEKYTYITIRSLVFKVIAIVAMFLLVRTSDDYIIYAGITVFSSTGSFVLNFLYARKYIYFDRLKYYNVKQHLKPIFIFFAMTCATTVYVNIDAIMLGFIKGDSEVGIYNVAVKVRTVMLHVVTAFGAVLLPRATYYVKEKMFIEFYGVARKIINIVVIISVPIILYFVVYAKETILLLSGKEYITALIPMQLIMPTLLFAGVSNVTGIQMLIPLGKEKIVLKSEILGAIVDVILNTILIPVYASTGAAIATVLAELTVLIVQCMSLKTEIKKVAESIGYLKILISVMCSMVGSMLVFGLIDNRLFRFMATGLTFFGIYGGGLLVLKEDIICELCYPLLNRFQRRK